MSALTPTGSPAAASGPRAADSRAVDVGALARDLSAVIEGDVRIDPVSRALYATDASVYQIEPLGVVVPRSRADLAAIVDVCRRHGCPITMRGGGTSQSGQAIGGGLVVDTSKHLHRILDIDVAGRRAHVEPGIVLDALNAALKPHGLRFAPDVSTASRATVGGMMANNSSGARSVLYGKTIDHVLEQEVILSDGTLARFGPRTGAALEEACRIEGLEGACYRTVRRLARTHRDEIDRRFPKVLRRVGGYNLDAFVDPDGPFNLARLMVGSEGTLGVVSSAVVHLVPLPAAKAVLVIAFDSLLESLAAAPLVLEHQPSAVEVMDRFILDHTRSSPLLDAARRAVIDGDAGALLCVEFYADHAEALPPRLDALERALAAAGHAVRCRRATTDAEQARVWGLREAALGLSMAMKDDAKSLSFVEDTAVPPERLRDYIERFLQIVARHGTVAGVYAHASVGCLHVRPVVNMKTAEGLARFEAIATEVSDLVLEFGGALSGEHGDGLVRSPFMRKMFGDVLYGAFCEVKRTFDPDGLFNPGKIVDAPPLTANLRYGAGYRTPEPVTHFDFGEYGGMGRAVEMCSGVGACRKTRDGTMCPSYMATGEELHSTRGRANVLRLAMNGRLDAAGLDDEGVYQALDLCLECRACRTECPVGVDMARLKSEFLDGYWRRQGTPLSARVLGNAGTLAAWGSALAPVANRLADSALGRELGARVLGLDRRRRLPRFASRTLVQQAPAADARADALLFVDTFTNHYDPEIGLAALRVMRAAGATPGLAPYACCGRPQISKGLLGRARVLAEASTARLHDLVDAGRPLVFCEPSCLSAVREDVPDLLTGEARRRARRVAEAAVLFEDWAAARVERLHLAAGPSRILLHGHCHQKAMRLVAPAAALLRTVPGVTVEELDAGCCGMAGSFGYTADHYEVSRAIGERRLLPAVRQAGPDAVVVAAGTSCRHQVHDFTGVTAVHPAVLLASLLERESP
ncbi:MAG: FAD-binding and (Fe-S)-binding domain-containing protein [Vicinamibacterales bacterium]